jgi:hypothetical protein
MLSSGTPSLLLITAHEGSTFYFQKVVIDSQEAPIAYIDKDVKIDFDSCDLTAPHDLGIEARSRSKVRMSFTTAHNCKDTALLVLDEATIELADCKFTENSADAIELSTSSDNNTIVAATISENESGAGILCTGKGKLTLVKLLIFLTFQNVTDCSIITLLYQHLSINHMYMVGFNISHGHSRNI